MKKVAHEIISIQSTTVRLARGKIRSATQARNTTCPAAIEAIPAATNAAAKLGQRKAPTNAAHSPPRTSRKDHAVANPTNANSETRGRTDSGHPPFGIDRIRE